MSVDWPLALRDGAILAAGASALIVGSLRLNPRLFLADFPEPVRRRLPPKSDTEKRQSLLAGLALIGWMLAGLAASTAAAEAAGASDLPSLAAHAYVVGMVFNVVDWLIIDELWLGLARPSWVFPPGVDPARVPFEHAKHFRDFVKGSILFALIAGIVALLVWLI